MASGTPPSAVVVRRALVVDDDGGILRSLVKAFEVRGWVVHGFGDAESALAALPGPEYHAAVIDKVLPGVSGLELVRRIRQRGMDVPIILTTGSSDVNTARELLSLKVDAHVSKPFGDVFEVVRRAEALADRQDRQRDQLRRRSESRAALPPPAGPPPSPVPGPPPAALARPTTPPPRQVRLPPDGAAYLSPASAAPSWRLLVVDDEASVRLSLATVFEADGWDVRTCLEAERAVPLLERERFDLLLVDKNLPGTMSGVDLVRHVRESGSRVPIVLMTAFPTVESAMRVMPYRVDAYVLKPFEDVYEVLHRARSVVERHRREEEQRRARVAAWQRRTEETADTPVDPSLGAARGVGPAPGMGPRFLVASTAKDAEWIAKELADPAGRRPIVRTLDELKKHVQRQPADVVLLDTSFEQMLLPALEALGALADAPITIVTGDRPSLAMLPRLIGAGASGFIEKPFGTGDAFRRRVTQILAPLAAGRRP